MDKILRIPSEKIKKIFIVLDIMVHICYDNRVINVINS